MGLTRKMQKHLEELGENTSGGAHDAVTFTGKGLNVLSGLFKGAKRKPEQTLEKEEDEDEDEFEDVDPEDMELDEMEDFIDEHDVDDAPEQKKDESDEKYEKRLRRFLKKWLKAQKDGKKTAKNANGGELEEEDEDELDDPADGTKNSIISNKGERIKKNANGFDERRFEKNFDELEAEHGEVLDASPALASFAQQMRMMAKNQNATYSGMQDLQESFLILAKGLEQSLKAQAAMAADLELIKKQPVNQPASGLFATLNKNNSNSGQRKLSKSEIQDSLAVLLNKGEIDYNTLSRLDFCHSEHELRSFVESLPQDIQNQL